MAQITALQDLDLSAQDNFVSCLPACSLTERLSN